MTSFDETERRSREVTAEEPEARRFETAEMMPVDETERRSREVASEEPEARRFKGCNKRKEGVVWTRGSSQQKAI